PRGPRKRFPLSRRSSAWSIRPATAEAAAFRCAEIGLRRRRLPPLCGVLPGVPGSRLASSDTPDPRGGETPRSGVDQLYGPAATTNRPTECEQPERQQPEGTGFGDARRRRLPRHGRLVHVQYVECPVSVTSIACDITENTLTAPVGGE